MCILKEALLNWLHGDAFSVCAAEPHFLPLMPSNLFCYLFRS